MHLGLGTGWRSFPVSEMEKQRADPGRNVRSLVLCINAEMTISHRGGDAGLQTDSWGAQTTAESAARICYYVQILSPIYSVSTHCGGYSRNITRSTSDPCPFPRSLHWFKIMISSVLASDEAPRLSSAVRPPTSLEVLANPLTLLPSSLRRAPISKLSRSSET